MALPQIIDRVLETANAPGVGNVTLTGVPNNSYQPFSKFGNNAKCYYTIYDATQSEWGVGTVLVGAPNQLQRTTVIGNSVGTNVALDFANPVTVFCGIPGEKLINLDDDGNLQWPGLTAADAGKSLVVANDGSAGVLAGPLHGFKNRLINPFAEIDQEHEGGAINVVAPTGRYVLDGCGLSFNTAAGTLSVQRVADAPPGFKNSLKITVTAAAGAPGATDSGYVYFPIEGNNIADFQWGTANAKNVSFGIKIKFSVAGNYGFFATNQAGTRTYVKMITITAEQVNTWVFVPIENIFGDTQGAWATDTGLGVSVGICLFMGANYFGVEGWQNGVLFTTNAQTQALQTLGATFQFTGWQFEEGQKCTAIERRPYIIEKMLCQRYYEKSYDDGVVPGTIINNSADVLVAIGSSMTGCGKSVHYNVMKRTTPTLSCYSTATGASGKLRDLQNNVDVTAQLGGFAGMKQYFVDANTATSSTTWLGWHWVADARL